MAKIMNVQNDNSKVRVTLITTGGTIEKSYDEYDGSLENRESMIRSSILSHLRLPYTELQLFSILAKDSLDMDDEDREFLTTSIKHHSARKNPIVVLHGTDTMEESARHCAKHLENPTVPIIFTGAMRPLGFEDSDARQNVTEALLSVKILPPGVYIVFHNRIFNVPKVRKNKEKRTFESY